MENIINKINSTILKDFRRYQEPTKLYMHKFFCQLKAYQAFKKDHPQKMWNLQMSNHNTVKNMNDRNKTIKSNKINGIINDLNANGSARDKATYSNNNQIISPLFRQSSLQITQNREEDDVSDISEDEDSNDDDNTFMHG